MRFRTMIRTTKTFQEMVEPGERVFDDISATTDLTTIRCADSRAPRHQLKVPIKSVEAETGSV